jgi:hypothetical protein
LGLPFTSNGALLSAVRSGEAGTKHSFAKNAVRAVALGFLHSIATRAGPPAPARIGTLPLQVSVAVRITFE